MPKFIIIVLIKGIIDMLFKTLFTNSNVEPNEINRYRAALLNILRRVIIDKDDIQLNEDLKIVYQLLSHLQLKTDEKEHN